MAKFWKLLVHLLEGYENGGRQKATSHSENETGERKPPRKRWWWWLLRGEGKWHPWGPWEKVKESPERLCSEGGTLAKEELPSRGTGLLTLLQTMGRRSRGREREKGAPEKPPTEFCNNQSIIINFIQRYYDEKLFVYWMNTFDTMPIKYRGVFEFDVSLLPDLCEKNSSWNVS